MKIQITKKNGVSEILIDGHCVSRGCMGWEVSSKGGGFVMLEIRFIAKETDISVKVDDPLSQAQEEQELKKSRRLFHSNSQER